jgi:hypothetical protein
MQAVVPTAVSIGGVVTHLHAVERPEARSLPSISSLVITSACYALLGYALARLRWWAGMPCLLFLALTLSASFERLDDHRARGSLPSAFTAHYLAYHSVATIVAAAIIVYGMRTQHLRRGSRR